MKNLAYEGDATSHGGNILTGSDRIKIKGRRAARVGDKVSYPIHGDNEIVEGSSRMRDGTTSLSRDGDVWAFGLFTWFGFRIFAAKGKVQIQAQSDAMELMSMQDMTASSSDGEVVITGRKGVTLGDGAGAYLKLPGGKIILGSPAGEIEIKGNLTINDADGGNFKFPAWSPAPLNDVKKVMNFGFSE